jgi:hypothetical protein
MTSVILSVSEESAFGAEILHYVQNDIERPTVPVM